MRRRTFIIFTLYTWCRVLYGLLFHPYKTTREIVRHPILAPVLLTPFLSLITLFFLGRVGALIVEVYGTSRTLVALVLGSSLFAILFWQLLLLFFLLSLISAKRKE